MPLKYVLSWVDGCVIVFGSSSIVTDDVMNSVLT